MAKSRVTGFEAFAKQLEEQNKKLMQEEKQIDEFFESCAKKLAAKFIRKVKLRTPVGQYDDFDIPAHEVNFKTKDGKEVSFHVKAKHVEYKKAEGKTGSDLQKGWTKDKNVTKGNGVYTINVINPIQYASYVEYGHRGIFIPELGKTVRLNQRFTKGQFMMTITEKEMEQSRDSDIEKKFNKFLREVFDGK
jgi:hypothetical protein